MLISQANIKQVKGKTQSQSIVSIYSKPALFLVTGEWLTNISVPRRLVETVGITPVRCFWSNAKIMGELSSKRKTIFIHTNLISLFLENSSKLRKMFSNLSLYVAQEHTMAAFKNLHQTTNQYSPYNTMESVSSGMFEPVFHQIPAYQTYAPKDKVPNARNDMHIFEGHRPLHFPSFHVGLPQRLPSPNRAPTWHQTTSIHQQAQMSLGDQESLQIPMVVSDKCPYMDDKKSKPCSSAISLSDHDAIRPGEADLNPNKLWTPQSQGTTYYDQKGISAGGLHNWIYENPNVVLGKQKP